MSLLPCTTNKLPSTEEALGFEMPAYYHQHLPVRKIRWLMESHPYSILLLHMLQGSF